jgi:hypothetical protein
MFLEAEKISKRPFKYHFNVFYFIDATNISKTIRYFN